MIVAGVMSGTSADGINVALVRIADGAKNLQFKLLGHTEIAYPKAVRQAVLSAMNASSISVADLARLNFVLAELYAGAVIAAQKKFRIKAELVGCHGQTIYHQGDAAPFLGRKVAVTWQTGEGAVLAARVGAPVVSDFRPADMAVGGKGAPLVPFLDYFLYRDPKVGRIVQNIGGIGNLTAIAANATPKQVVAFDTGPGNMVIDAVTQKLFGKPFDREGKIAAQGTPREDVIGHFLKMPFFASKPPRTAGREEFGAAFVRSFLGRCGKTKKEDVVATATAFTARSIAESLKSFVIKKNSYRDFIVSGGGTRNATLLAMLANELKPIGLQVRSTDEFGLPSEAKEAAAFALLAYQTWHRRTSNIPSATGAKRPAILGKISYA
ncbi:MAG TPA: anhydro-N-acetylmuramic acid kinase [Terriglobales bacterium]|jgi:anhydro-N-acetylmuramic acid kinase|nr:anhydro-N-acetylmuramic acid kinase [Terriglobales bacterium]